jgi:hypothetical protein
MAAEQSDDFYASLKPFDRFAEVLDVTRYHPLPADWIAGTADVVNSTGAIAEGRYKVVNMVGASVISAALNELHDMTFPFVFGGDGAALAVPAGAAEKIRRAMATVQSWAKAETGLTLRAALVPLAHIRQAGLDVSVARFQASPHVSYAMFAGGGMAWAERQMKAGRFAVPPAGPDDLPNLEGLSCRWQPIPSRQGIIVSLLVTPARGTGDPGFVRAVSEIVRLVATEGREGHPVPAEGPGFRWPPPGLELEAKASRGTTPLDKQRRKLRIQTLVARLLDITGIKLGGFDPRRYKTTTASNTDFRKFDDGLKLTIDCTEALATSIEQRLEAGRQSGALYYGLHRQPEAQMTCIVPSFMTDDHFHFVDGSSGGYARAAEGMKAQMARGNQASGIGQ